MLGYPNALRLEPQEVDKIFLNGFPQQSDEVTFMMDHGQAGLSDQMGVSFMVNGCGHRKYPPKEQYFTPGPKPLFQVSSVEFCEPGGAGGVHPARPCHGLYPPRRDKSACGRKLACARTLVPAWKRIC